MAREENTRLVAPGADLVEVAGAEAPPHQLRVDRPHLDGGVVREEALDVGAEVAPGLGAVFVLHADPAAEVDAAVGLQDDVGVVAGLVGEDAEDGLRGEVLREALLVDLVRHLDEEADRLRLADVHPALRRQDDFPAEAAAFLRVDRPLAVAEALVGGGDASLAGAARPVVLVVEPYLHAVLLGLAAERLDGVEPLLAHVLVLEAAPRVDEELVEAVGLERGDLAPEFGVGGTARHRKKRHDGVDFGGRAKRANGDRSRREQHDKFLHIAIIPYFRLLRAT